MENPNEYQLKRDHKHDLAFRPLETALEKGTIDAMYSQSKVLSVLSETTGKFKSIEDLSRYPDWTLQGVANVPATLTVTDVACEQHPELIVALLKGLIKVGRWANAHQRAASAILNKQTYYRDEEDTYEGIRRVEFVPVLSPINLQTLQINKDFMLSHGYIENDFDVFRVGRTGVPRTGRQGAARRRMEDTLHGQAAQGHLAGRRHERADRMI